MALLQLSSLSFGLTKMLLPRQRKSSSLTISNSNVPCPTQCMASNKVSNNSETVLRRSANFKPSIWTYDYIQSLSSEYKEEMHAEQRRVLREEVRIMLCEVENEVDQLELIDVLQRLGVDYHFDKEIRNILDNIYYMDASKRKKNLHATALEFRLLRQHAYDISTDVFDCFHDETGNFKKCKYDDIEGMLSLYEASFHSFEDETILDEARDFTSEILKEYLNQNRVNLLSLLIGHALELPIHWRIPRWEAQWFIHAYERKPNTSPVLLQLAKLDFNILQAIYQDDLKYKSRWWKRTSLGEKLTFARDRVVENFIWTVGSNFKPDFGYSRKVIAKGNALVTTIDDVYDVYGTLEELELFTEAIDRWDLNAIDNLPDYMKICFHTLYNFVHEMALEVQEKNGYNITPYLKKAWADICKSYLIEAKWYHSGYKPSFGEYIENGWISISAPVILVHAYFAIPHSFRNDDLVNLEEYSDIIRCIIIRLANDLGTYKREIETGDIPKSIQCYMNESGASEGDAREYVKSIMCKTWTKMNEEARSSSFSRSFIETAINLTRMALWMYQHGDGVSIQDSEIKSRILSLLIQPIPVAYTKK
ncbi:terpene synthase 10-like [Gastrolobium bilobum]|uniref:terpene synthase 10-like n=1 Tax=Gastrolobium bilobum TaxID=150636 RepID=UPI002AB22ABA|nr:terpene synthase 10-like [Gastrolobium bilobum]